MEILDIFGIIAILSLLMIPITFCLIAREESNYLTHSRFLDSYREHDDKYCYPNQNKKWYIFFQKPQKHEWKTLAVFSKDLIPAKIRCKKCGKIKYNHRDFAAGHWVFTWKETPKKEELNENKKI